jgi:hypothetical protein
MLRVVIRSTSINDNDMTEAEHGALCMLVVEGNVQMLQCEATKMDGLARIAALTTESHALFICTMGCSVCICYYRQKNWISLRIARQYKEYASIDTTYLASGKLLLHFLELCGVRFTIHDVEFGVIVFKT